MIITPENIINEITLEITLNWQLSKNNRIGRTMEGRTLFNKNQNAIDLLSKNIFYTSKANACVWEKRKVWVFITAHKNNLRGDVANFVDSVSDAIKEAIKTNDGGKIDDNLFSFVLDWVVDKKETMTIRILQESEDSVDI